ncbi:MAG: penicillin-binding protein dacF [Candidatus Xenolissoclinum pacificiensis L6]|uniref:Penicillin-binding protein dacF n=1 Tax=Candidatus Xenolissoclinum pacificiensis L6 TaxID=1401685 RepID=W2V0G2_9RICK|nr:MAG: penicillin-binding protein dacF [Candidatus Xenolissoclinum pacificiensis L6]
MKHTLRIITLYLCLLVPCMGNASKDIFKEFAGIIVDTTSGKILFAHNADQSKKPASLVKVMVLYVIFDYLHNGIIHWDDPMPVSHYATTQPASKLNLKIEDYITVAQAIHALIIKSANDVAVVLAEYISGTEDQFAQLMNEYANVLGMKNTWFMNASGLDHEKQYSTAFDLALLGYKIRRDFPNYYSRFQDLHFQYHLHDYASFNTVLKNYNGADGLKTGFTSLAGFNIATSITYHGHQYIAVTLGLPSKNIQYDVVSSLLDYYIKGIQT